MPTPLDTLLTQSDPLQGIAPAPESVTDLSAALAREVVDADRRTKGRRLGVLRRHKWATAAIAALVVVPTSAYAASRFLAQTGTYDVGITTGKEDSEFIDLCAPDVGAYLASKEAPTDPLPAGSSWATVVGVIAAELRSVSPNACPPNGPGLLEAAVGLRGTLYFYGQREWACDAIAADKRGDAAAVKAAGKGMASLLQRQGDMGILAGNSWQAQRDEWAAGDITRITQFVTANFKDGCRR